MIKRQIIFVIFYGYFDTERLIDNKKPKRMKIYHIFDPSFGPVGSKAGLLVFAVGIIMIFYSVTAVILIVFGAFTGFSNSGTTIDPEKKRVRFSNNLFGIIPVGKWISIDKDMKIVVRKSMHGWRSYSRGNRVHDDVTCDFKISLDGADRKELMPLKRCSNQELAFVEAEKLCRTLEIGCPQLAI